MLETNRTTHRPTRISEPNPYKKVWNSLQDEEAALQEAAKNCVLFAPTYAQMAGRYIKRSKWHLSKARDLGRTTAGLAEFEEAMAYRNMAKNMLDQQHLTLLRSR